MKRLNRYYTRYKALAHHVFSLISEQEQGEPLSKRSFRFHMNKRHEISYYTYVKVGYIPNRIIKLFILTKDIVTHTRRAFSSNMIDPTFNVFGYHILSWKDDYSATDCVYTHYTPITSVE